MMISFNEVHAFCSELEFLNILGGQESSRTRIIVPARQATQAGELMSENRFLGFLKSLKILALNSKILCLLCTVYYCITADQMLSLPFIEGWFRFCEFYFSGRARIKGKYSFFYCIKSPLIITFVIINLQIYRIIDYIVPLLLTQILMEKGTSLHQNSKPEKHIYCKKLFCFYVLAILYPYYNFECAQCVFKGYR